jgi:uncharacterized membrane protein
MADTNSNASSEDFLGIVSSAFKSIKESWEALLLNLLTFILVALVPMLIIGISVPLLILPLFVGGSSPWLAVLLAILIITAAIVVACLFIPAMVVTQLASAKGQKIGFDEALKKGMPYVLRYIGLALLVGLCVIIGMFLLIIPGLLAAFFLSMSFYLLVDKNIGVIEAMKQSINLTKKYWMWILALFIVNMAVSIVGYFPFIGWILSLAGSIAYFCLPAIIYLKITKK